MAAEMNSPIVHLCSQAEWQTAQARGEFRDVSLEKEGFIHCSLPAQVARVANTYYPSLPDPLLLWIDPAQLHSPLKWENSGQDIFPHIYGPLNLEAVFQIQPYPKGRDGVYPDISAWH